MSVFKIKYQDKIMKTNKLTIILAISLGMISCADLNNQSIGTITGGAVGGLIGSRFGGGAGRVAAAAGGTIIGAYLGGRVGQTMDRLDAMNLQNTLETKSTGNKAVWTNPDSGNAYTVTPTSTYYSNSRPCRKYQMTAKIDGKLETINGTACRQQYGSWKSTN